MIWVGRPPLIRSADGRLSMSQAAVDVARVFHVEHPAVGAGPGWVVLPVVRRVALAVRKVVVRSNGGLLASSRLGPSGYGLRCHSEPFGFIALFAGCCVGSGRAPSTKCERLALTGRSTKAATDGAFHVKRRCLGHHPTGRACNGAGCCSVTGDGLGWRGNRSQPPHWPYGSGRNERAQTRNQPPWLSYVFRAASRSLPGAAAGARRSGKPASNITTGGLGLSGRRLHPR